MNRVPFTPLTVTVDDAYKPPPAPKTPHRANAAKIQALIMSIGELRASFSVIVNKLEHLEREIAVNRRGLLSSVTRADRRPILFGRIRQSE